ncbi:MAG: DUF1801 domain-containing protein [Planctomycetota bacterium]
MSKPKSVDDYIASADHWGDELASLRAVLLKTELEETIKWGAPCYTLEGKNVVGLAAFKAYVGLWFHQGALLSDPKGVLINAQEGKTKALRQWRFTKPSEIKPRIIASYVNEAIELQRSGRDLKPDRAKPVSIPDELAEALRVDKKANASFDKLAKGKQREFADHVSEAKKQETRLKRAAKAIGLLREGKGLNDKYR